MVNTIIETQETSQLFNKENEVLFRPLLLTDIDAVSRICEQMENFTTPPEYVYWMMLRTQNKFCQTLLVNNRIISYFLALSTSKTNEIFIWQMGVLNFSLNKGKFIGFWEYYLQILLENDIKRIYFTFNEKNMKLSSYILRTLGLNQTIIPTGRYFNYNGVKEYEYFYEF